MPTRCDHGRRSDVRAALRDPLQLVLEIPRGLPSIFAIFSEALLDDPLHRLRAERAWLVLQNRAHEGRGALALEGPDPREHLVQHDAESPNIRSGIDRLAHELFGRHVSERPDEMPLPGQFLLPGGSARILRTRYLLRVLRQAEVEHLHARLGQHDVTRLQVPVNDPGPVGRGEAVRNLNSILEGFFGRRSQSLGSVHSMNSAPEIDAPAADVEGNCE
jgi:hypothetical protein